MSAGVGENLPGGDLVDQGLRDLAAGRQSEAALLVAIGAPRLRRLGVSPPSAAELPSLPELRLYRRLSAENPRAAHSRYNALIRRLVSFERALEREQGQTIRRARGAILDRPRRS